MDKEIRDKMQNEYFEYKGQRYYAGTKFKMQKRNSYDQWRIVVATFEGYWYGDSNKLYFCYKDMNVKSPLGSDYSFFATRDEVEDIVIEIVPGNYYVELEARKRYVKDSNIPELVIGWPLYIFCMIGGMIFKGYFNGGWLLITLIFFVWRHYLKTKEYYYYE